MKLNARQRKAIGDLVVIVDTVGADWRGRVFDDATLVASFTTPDMDDAYNLAANALLSEVQDRVAAALAQEEADMAANPYGTGWLVR